MKIYNTVYSIEEYIAQGFTAEEAPKMVRHDTLVNKLTDGLATEEEYQEIFAIAEELGL
jgi:hypothetical protein